MAGITSMGWLAAETVGAGGIDTTTALVLVGVSGFFAFIVSYLSNWLWRIKGEKGVFSSRLQFDKEFAIYERLWASLARLSAAARACTAETGDATALAAARKEAHAAVFEASPFYAEAVFIAAQRALATAQQVGAQAEGRAAADRLEQELAQVSAAIRERVWGGK